MNERGKSGPLPVPRLDATRSHQQIAGQRVILGAPTASASRSASCCDGAKARPTLTHRPTGSTVTAREERSQHRNRTLALARLADRLAEHRDRAAGAARREAWAGHPSLERGNPVRTFQGEGFQPTG